MSCDSETFYLLFHGRDAVKAKNAELRRDLGIFVDKGDVSAAIAYMNALEVDWWRSDASFHLWTCIASASEAQADFAKLDEAKRTLATQAHCY